LILDPSTNTYGYRVHRQLTDTTADYVFVRVGDYIAYVGPDEDTTWKKNHVIRLTENGWECLDPLSSKYTDYYMRALRDITEGADVGAFSTLFAQKIMAMEATIETLQAKIIKLYNPNNHNNYIELNGQQGRLRSSNYANSLSARQGFSLESADGSATFDKVNTWKMETRPAIMKYVSITGPGYAGPNWGLQSLRQLGGIRAIFQFWKDSSGFGGYATMAVDYDDNANINTIAEIKQTTTTGVFQIEYTCRSSDEVEIMKRARIFGYYSLNSKASGVSGTSYDGSAIQIPNQWGMIIQDSPGRSAQVNGMKVTLTFACKDNNSDTLEENPAWYGTAFLLA